MLRQSLEDQMQWDNKALNKEKADDSEDDSSLETVRDAAQTTEIASRNNWSQMAAGHDVSVKADTGPSIEGDGAERYTHSLIQVSSFTGLLTTSDLTECGPVTMVRQHAQKEHSTAPHHSVRHAHLLCHQARCR